MTKHNSRSLAGFRDAGVPISWLTCYEYSFAGLHEIACLAEEAFVSEVKSKSFPTQQSSYRD